MGEQINVVVIIESIFYFAFSMFLCYIYICIHIYEVILYTDNIDIYNLKIIIQTLRDSFKSLRHHVLHVIYELSVATLLFTNILDTGLRYFLVPIPPPNRGLHPSHLCNHS